MFQAHSEVILKSLFQNLHGTDPKDLLSIVADNSWLYLFLYLEETSNGVPQFSILLSFYHSSYNIRNDFH